MHWASAWRDLELLCTEEGGYCCWLGSVLGPLFLSSPYVMLKYFGQMIPPRGCAYIVMVHRQDAYRALQKLSRGNYKVNQKSIKVTFLSFIKGFNAELYGVLGGFLLTIILLLGNGLRHKSLLKKNPPKSSCTLVDIQFYVTISLVSFCLRKFFFTHCILIKLFFSQILPHPQFHTLSL